MSNSFIRMLKLAETLYNSGDSEGFNRLCVQFNAYLRKCAHYEPVNDGTTPNPWRHNMDYAGWENSPYYGSMTEFMERFPGGIPDWIKWRRETQKERNLMWSKISARRDLAKTAVGADTSKIQYWETMSPEEKSRVIPGWDDLPYHELLEKIKKMPDKEEVAMEKEEVAMEKAVNKWKNEMRKSARESFKIYIEEALKVAANEKEKLRWKLVAKNQHYLNILDKYVEKEMVDIKLPPMIRTLIRFRGTPKYKMYSDLFFRMVKEIVDSAVYKLTGELDKLPVGTAAEDVPKKTIEAHFVPVGPDDTKDFPKEPHLWSDEGLEKFKSVTEYLKKYRGQYADDMGSSALKAIQDFIDYWKLLQKGKKRRKKRTHGKK